MGVWVGRVLLVPRRSHGCCRTAQGWPVPTGQSKRETGPSAPESPPALAPKPWHPGGGWGVAVGQPTVVARQGRQDTGRGLLPATPGPGDAAASQGGDPARGMWGAACPPPPRPNSPNSPSGCRTQPHRPAAPCMYSYLHYVQSAQWVGAPPSLRRSRDGDKGPSGCGSHSPTPPGGMKPPPHTHTPPQPFPCVAR